ncbi:MAG: histidine phosphatase family protein [Polyangiaceae bacterium]|nr:histidine phosphatase family protein [Polyangiaceae bacterium]
MSKPRNRDVAPGTLRLIVMRHAKSDWHTGAQTDHERPLNERGKREAPVVGKQLAEKGYVPELVLCSDSARTSETYDRIKPYFPDARIEYLRDLYHASIGEVRAVLDKVPAGTQSLMLLGHNPGWEDMVTELAGEPVEMKTANAAVLEADAATFAEAIAPGKRMRLVHVVTPK